MLDQPVILGFVPTSASPAGSMAWAVSAMVDDPLEINDGWAVARGDVVFLDLRGSDSAPGTVGRYTVSSITSKASRNISVVLEWDAASAAISPAECLNIRGYLAQPIDVVGTVMHPTQQTILIPQAMIDLAKEVERYAVGDAAEDEEQVCSLPAGELIQPGQMVKLLDTGMVVAASPQDPSRMPATGIALTGGTGLVRVRVGGRTPQLATSLIPGAPVFVGNGGLPITDPAGITLPAAIQIVGVALSASTVALTITGSLVKRA